MVARRSVPPPQRALVLGGGSDIAAACVAALAEHGLRTAVLAARDPDAARARVAAATDRVDLVPVRWDVLDLPALDDLWSATTRSVGTPDMVLCAVGSLGHHAGLGMSPTDVEAMARTNYAAPAAALAHVAERLAADPGDGRTIVVLSSVAGVRPRRSNYVYGSSKAGLDSFARGLGDALHGSGVRVLVVRPGFVRSRMTAGLDPAPFATDPEVVAAAVARAVAGGRDGVLSVPPLLGPLFAVLGNVPGGLWRRIAGDR